MDSGSIVAKRSADIQRDDEHLPPHSHRRLASQCAAAARRRAGRGAARSGQAVSRHRLASVDVPARDRATVPGWHLAVVRQPTDSRCQPVQLRRDHRSGRAVRRHLHLHAAGAANSRRSRAASWASTTPAHFFWASGSLSSVLDNAPTYLVFFKTAQSLPTDSQVVPVAGVDPLILAASAWARCSWAR